MDELRVGCLTLVANATVIQLPERRFPGIVIQGDSLSVLVNDVKAAQLAAKQNRTADLLESLRELHEKLVGYQRVYEEALAREGIRRPY